MDPELGVSYICISSSRGNQRAMLIRGYQKLYGHYTEKNPTHAF